MDNDEKSAVGALTDVDHWNAAWLAMPNTRFWSIFDPGISDSFHLLAKHIPFGARVLEIGFAPGKYLAWAALKRRAQVSGVDFSPQGTALAHQFFNTLGIAGDIRTENVFETTFAPDTFDCVYSNGVVEHFDDPRPLVAKHLELTRPGGKVVITYPNYGGLLGRIQGKLEPENLAIHNLAIMSRGAARELFEGLPVSDLQTFSYGRPALNSLGLEAVSPRLGGMVKRAAAVMGHLFPRPLSPLRPLICAVATKAGPN